MDALLSTAIAAIAADLPRITAKFLELSDVHLKPHTGVDFAIPIGTKLRSVGDGIVESVVDYGTKNVGKGVFIRLENGVKLLYGHLQEPLVQVGQKVQAGDIIGLSGNTGRSTGPHLHLQAYDVKGKLIDPTSMAEGVFNAPKFADLAKLNPFKGLEDRMDKMFYWVNPLNWLKEIWKVLEAAFRGGTLDIPLIIVTVAGIWLVMLGVKDAKKWIFWTWIIYWLCRAVIFV